MKGESNDMSNESDGKKIEVSCAIIERDGLVLVAQRSETRAMPLKWECPGGKIKQGEEPDTCLKRELMEEGYHRHHEKNAPSLRAPLSGLHGYPLSLRMRHRRRGNNFA